MDTVAPVNPQKNNKTLLAIIGVAVLPVLAAYMAFFTGWGVPDNTVNAGQLLPNPIAMNALFKGVDSSVVSDIQTNKKWRIFIPVSADCLEDCQQNLYTTRQVHIRLSEKGKRLERYAINLGGEAGQSYLASIQAGHPYLKIAQADPQHWQSWLAQAQGGLEDGEEHFYFLVDQEGYAMMAYTREQHGNALLKDIKRALKFSIDYQ